MSKTLCILIPTLESRKDLFERVNNALNEQVKRLPDPERVKIAALRDNGERTTGEKRNTLVGLAVNAGADYIAFFDDDDMPGENYIQKQMEVVDSGLDCGSLWGDIYWSGKKGKPFHHFLDCKEWWEDDLYYYRCINHLNCVKLSLMKQIPFPEQDFGEDGVQSMDLKNSGLLKTEYKIDEVIYHYFAGNPKHEI